jgi:uncharacterized protein (TIGR03067 family)
MLKLSLAGFAVASLLLVGGQADEAAIKKERAKFKGTWKVAKFESAKGEEDKGKDITFNFSDDGIVQMSKGDKSKKATYKLNPAAKPKEIDIQPDEGSGDKGAKGIYEFTKDMLRLCFSDNETDRPKEFKAGVGTIIVTLEKAK